MLKWNDLIILATEVDSERILESWWSWLLPNPSKPVVVTAFGDWFVKNERGEINYIDLLEGTVSPVAASRREFERLLKDQNRIDDWFLPGFIESLQNRGITRPIGKCFGYRIHPTIGGPIEVSNIILFDFPVWQAFCSQLHEQIRQLVPGTRIKGVESVGDLRIRLLTEPKSP